MSFFSDRRHNGNGRALSPTESAPLRAVPLPAQDELTTREPRCPGTYQPPGSCDRPAVLLDRLLERQILRHFARNFTPKLKAKHPASILGILGSTGIGKTMTAETTASRHDIGVLKIPGTDLGGTEPWLEGAAVATLNAALHWIDWKATVKKQKTCLIIDDIDASILPERPGATGTNNTDQLRGKLQTLADRDDAPCQIWTLNNSHYLKPALLRAGRCVLYHYHPDGPTTAAIVEHIFQPKTHHDRRHVQRIFYKYRHRPIAWFATLRSEQDETALDALIERQGTPLNFEALEAAHEPSEHLDIDALYAAAARADTDQGGDFSQ